eukprot:4000086-Heterocapsa_arctica.AAC.1
MAGDDNDNNATPQQARDAQATQENDTSDGPANSQPSQDDQHAEPTKHKTWMDNDPMRGVKYPPLSGPGPSGFRPEFITDLMTVRKQMCYQKAKNNSLYLF